MQKHLLQQLKQQIADCGHQHRRLFSQRFAQLSKHSASRQNWQALSLEVEQSLRSQALRAANRPPVSYTNDLPVHQHISDISKKIKENQVVIVCGETGSGKTTQLPKLCLEAGYGIKGLIGHTQPRRIAAKSIAARLAHELTSKPGEAVGYKIRHQDTTTDKSYIKIMTDGVLLAEMQQDRLLSAYDVLIIDEAHERSLNIDFILGYLRQLLPKRPELRVIITSATIDVQRFSEHFSTAPIIEVSGRRYPVDVRYRPLADDDNDEQLREQALLAAINELSQENQGDILVFLSGERDIQEIMAFLRKQSLSNTNILPLYSRLGSAAQARVFKSHNKRHIVLATNVAETSLTIDGISHVIDFGDARISRYSYKSKVQRLPIEKISQASADQRLGRCGRTHAGVCIRLYSEDDYLQRPRYTAPEILRTNLATVILQMKSMRLGQISAFPFIEAPPQRSINDGLRLLHELSAIDDDENLTAIGKQLARLPIDPRLGRMLLAAGHWHCLAEMLVIVSALSIQDPRERPLDAAEKADESHRRFQHKHSDFLAFMNLWNFYQAQKKKLSQNRLNKLCKRQFLSIIRMREWQDVQMQLRDIIRDLGLSINSESADYNNIHCAIISGLLSQLARRDEDKRYIGARSVGLRIFPGSSQFAVSPKWIMAAEFSETSRLYARTVASIDPKWALKPARHLLQRHHTEPHWDEKKQHIAAFESIELYGLTLVTRQRIGYARVNRKEARTLFIHEALVNLKLQTTAGYFLHNRSVIESIRELEHKSRRLDKLDEQALFDFYDQRLPDSIYSLQTLDGWRKQAEAEDAQCLFLQQQDIMRGSDDELTANSFPDQIILNQMPLPVSYRFLPGEPDDGVTLEIPLAMLNQIDALELDYLIPGQLKEKITFALKSLPKAIRKQLVPLPEFIDECLQQLQFGHQSLTDALSAYLFKTRGIRISAGAWQSAALPEHLQINLRVIDDNGVCLQQGRDLSSLKQQLAGQAEKLVLNPQTSSLEKNNITSWTFDDLPQQVITEVNKLPLTLYPALVDQTDSVAIKLFDTQDKANKALRQGLNRLFQLHLSKDIKYIKKHLPVSNTVLLAAAKVYPSEQLIDDIIVRTVDSLCVEKYDLVRSRSAFEDIIVRERTSMISAANELSRLVSKILQAYQKAMSSLSSIDSHSAAESIADIQSQLSHLIYPGFIKHINNHWLQQYPRYLQAVFSRLEKLQLSVNKDREKMTKLQPYWADYLQLRELMPVGDEDDDIAYYHWMLQEYRVSVFAQELKTSIKVSAKRLQQQQKIIRKKPTVVV